MAQDPTFKPLPNAAFLELSPEDAAQHLAEVRRNGLWPDSDRLHGVWWDRHKESLNSHVPEIASTTAPKSSTNSAESAMLGAGRALCICGIAVSLLAGAFGLLQLGTGGLSGVLFLGISYLAGSLATLGVIFWVAGALEQRLLEIRQALVANREA